MKLFKKEITQEDVDQLNTVNALANRPMIKVCKLCKHYDMHYGTERCARDRYPGFNRVTGKADTLGEVHYCESEREIKTTRPHSVKDKTCCGEIGQHWEPAPAKIGFWRKMIK